MQKSINNKKNQNPILKSAACSMFIHILEGDLLFTKEKLWKYIHAFNY